MKVRSDINHIDQTELYEGLCIKIYTNKNNTKVTNECIFRMWVIFLEFYSEYLIFFKPYMKSNIYYVLGFLTSSIFLKVRIFTSTGKNDVSWVKVCVNELGIIQSVCVRIFLLQLVNII